MAEHSPGAEWRRSPTAGAAVDATPASGSAGGPAGVEARIGAVQIVALLDAAGTFFRTAPDTFPSATADQWAAARRLDPDAFGPADSWRLAFHCFLIRCPGGPTILVDTGVGPTDGPAASWAPVPGHLLTNLAAAGVDVHDIDQVVLTHLHADHYAGSVTPDGSPVFPNAQYVLQRTEVEALAPDNPVRSYVIEPLLGTGQLHQIDGRTRLSGSRDRGGTVTAIATPGHTVGHQSLVVDSDGRELIVTGDVLVHAVQLVAPEVGYVLESDQPTAAATRQTLLAGARQREAVLATMHLTQPFIHPPHPQG